MRAEDERDGKVEPGWREGLRRVGLIAGLTVLLSPTALHVVFRLVTDPSRRPLVPVSTALHVSSLGAALLSVLPIAALLLALLLRPKRYRVVYWFAPLWFGANALSDLAIWRSISTITQSPVDLLFVALNAAVAVVLLVARPTAERRPEPEPPH